MLDCMNTCDKLNQARPPPSTTEQQLQEMRRLAIKFMQFPGTPYGSIWMSMTDGEEEGVWRDHYTGQEASKEVREVEIGGLSDKLSGNAAKSRGQGLNNVSIGFQEFIKIVKHKRRYILRYILSWIQFEKEFCL